MKRKRTLQPPVKPRDPERLSATTGRTRVRLCGIPRGEVLAASSWCQRIPELQQEGPFSCVEDGTEESSLGLYVRVGDEH